MAIPWRLYWTKRLIEGGCAFLHSDFWFLYITIRMLLTIPKKTSRGTIVIRLCEFKLPNDAFSDDMFRFVLLLTEC